MGWAEVPRLCVGTRLKLVRLSLGCPAPTGDPEAPARNRCAPNAPASPSPAPKRLLNHSLGQSQVRAQLRTTPPRSPTDSNSHEMITLTLYSPAIARLTGSSRPDDPLRSAGGGLSRFGRDRRLVLPPFVTPDEDEATSTPCPRTAISCSPSHVTNRKLPPVYLLSSRSADGVRIVAAALARPDWSSVPSQAQAHHPPPPQPTCQPLATVPLLSLLYL